jgi:hypothetical protein
MESAKGLYDGEEKPKVLKAGLASARGAKTLENTAALVLARKIFCGRKEVNVFVVVVFCDFCASLWIN